MTNPLKNVHSFDIVQEVQNPILNPYKLLVQPSITNSPLKHQPEIKEPAKELFEKGRARKSKIVVEKVNKEKTDEEMHDIH